MNDKIYFRSFNLASFGSSEIVSLATRSGLKSCISVSSVFCIHFWSQGYSGLNSSSTYGFKFFNFTEAILNPSKGFSRSPQIPSGSSIYCAMISYFLRDLLLALCSSSLYSISQQPPSSKPSLFGLSGFKVYSPNANCAADSTGSDFCYWKTDQPCAYCPS